MNKETLLADLRNKLGPVKNFFAVQRLLDSVNAEKEGSSRSEFMKGMEIAKLEEILNKEKILCEVNVSQIDYIISCLEKI